MEPNYRRLFHSLHQYWIWKRTLPNYSGIAKWSAFILVTEFCDTSRNIAKVCREYYRFEYVDLSVRELEQWLEQLKNIDEKPRSVNSIFPRNFIYYKVKNNKCILPGCVYFCLKIKLHNFHRLIITDKYFHCKIILHEKLLQSSYIFFYVFM